MRIGEERVTCSDEEKEKEVERGLLHSGRSLKSAHSPAGAKRNEGGRVRGREGVQQVEAWGERKVNQSGR